MRAFGILLSASILAAAAVPANAVGLGDLASVVLKGSSVLKKGQEKCGASLGLTSKEDLSLTVARSAAEKALPISEFLSLDTAAKAEADTAAKDTSFCATTKAAKPGILSKVKKAGQGLLKKKILG